MPRETLQVLVVEDEDYTRESLVEGINWQSAGCRVVGAVEDGTDALAFLESHHADIIVSDIRMEGMDGIELARRCRNQYPDVGFIFITGFGDLEYAREALRNRAWDFLLKPTQPEELESSLVRLGDHIRATQVRRTRLADALATASAANAALRRNQVRALLLGSSADLDQPREMEDTGRFSVVIVQLLNPADWAGPLTDVASSYDSRNTAKIVAAASRVIEREWDWAGLAPDRVALVVWGESASQQAERLALYLRDELGLTVVCGVSRSHVGLGEVGEARHEAEDALRRPFLRPLDVVIRFENQLLGDNRPHRRGSPAGDDQPSAPIGHAGATAEDIGTIEAAVRAGNSEEADAALQRLAAAAQEAGPLDSAQAAAEVLSVLRRACHEAGIQIELPRSLEVVLSGEDSPKMWEQVASWTRVATSKSAVAAEHGWSRLVRAAISFVHAHYREQIGVGDAAHHCNRSEKHLSRTLKDEIGMTFTELLTEIRLRNAEVILADASRSVAEVAFAVGFEDPAYFSRVFRKSRGMSPSEFRAKVRIRA
jgi:two-component system response regulator YesN